VYEVLRLGIASGEHLVLTEQFHNRRGAALLSAGL